eukprot:g662.t1
MSSVRIQYNNDIKTLALAGPGLASHVTRACELMGAPSSSSMSLRRVHAGGVGVEEAEPLVEPLDVSTLPDSCLLYLSDERDHAAAHVARLKNAAVHEDPGEDGGGGGETKGGRATNAERAATLLARDLKHSALAEEFIAQGGIAEVLRLVRASRAGGSAQAYALQALESLSGFANGVDFLVNDANDLLRDLFDLVAAPTPNVARVATRVLSATVRFGDSGFELVDAAIQEGSRRRQELPYFSVVRQLSNRDVVTRTNALGLLNNMVRHSPTQVVRAQLVQRLNKLETLQVLQDLVAGGHDDDPAMAREIGDFQALVGAVIPTSAYEVETLRARLQALDALHEEQRARLEVFEQQQPLVRVLRDELFRLRRAMAEGRGAGLGGGRWTFWDDVSEPQINAGDLEQRFGQAPPSRKAAALTGNKKKKAAVLRVLESARSQNIGIVLAKLPNLPILERAVLDLDEVALSREDVQQLMLFQPTAEELKLLDNAEKDWRKANPTGAAPPWDKAERMLLMFKRIPLVSVRLSAWLAKLSFDEMVGSITPVLETLREACSQLRSSGALKAVFGAVLAAGNYLNGSTRRGQADGFKLNVLSRLSATKDSTGKKNLLDWVAQVLLENAGSVQGGADLSALAKAARKAARLSLQDVRGKVKQLTNTIERTDRGVKQVAKLPQAQRMGVERFEESIGEFLRQASMQGEATATNFAEVERAYVKTVMFMTCDPEAKAQKVECDEFWGLLADFLEEQQRAIVKERERLAKLAGGSGGAAGGAGGDRGETKRFKPRHKAGTKLKIEGAGDGEGG